MCNFRSPESFPPQKFACGAIRNRGPLGRLPQFLIWAKESGPKSPADFLKAISKAPYLTVRLYICNLAHVRAMVSALRGVNTAVPAVTKLGGG